MSRNHTAKIFFVLLTGLAFVLLLNSSLSSGEEIVVDENGNGDYTTIQNAIDNAQEGDTIRVWAGSYEENVVVNKTVTIIGNGSASTTIDGGGEGSVVTINVNWVNLTGFHITGSGNDTDEAGVLVVSDQNQINNNNCSGNQYGIYLKECERNSLKNNYANDSYYGIYLYDSGNNTLTGNTAFNNTREEDAKGIVLDKSSYNELENNVANNNTEIGIWIYNSSHHNTLTKNFANGNLDVGIWLETNAHHNTLDENTCNENADTGIRLDGESEENTIKNNTCSNNDYGINADDADENTFMNNTCSYNGYHGIYSYSSDESIIENNLCYNNSESGIYTYSANYDTIENNQCNNNSENGINVEYSDDTSLVNNTCYNNTENGILLEYAYYILVENNILTWNDNAGLCTDYDCGYIDILENNCSYNVYGMYLESDDNTIEDNVCNRNTMHGIYLESLYDTSISNNTCSYNAYEAIYLYYSDDVLIENNTLTWNGDTAIYVYYCCDTVDILRNNCSNNAYGIYVEYCCDDITITDNVCNQNTEEGIYLDENYDIFLTNNTCNDNGGDGIYSYYSSVTVDDCVSSNNVLDGIEIDNSGWFTIQNCTSTGNERDGISVKKTYYGEIMNNTSTKNNQSGLYLYDSHHIDVRDNEFTYQTNWEGIYLSESDNNTIVNNICNWNADDAGIWLRDSGWNVVRDNDCSYNYYGIYVDPSNNTEMENNTCNDNTYGLYLEYSDRCNITNNEWNDNYYGVYLYSSDYSNISNNDCNDNYYYGIYLEKSNHTAIVNNSCVENGGTGIYINDVSTDNYVENNNCTYNDYGIYVEDSDSNTIIDNDCSDNGYGIYIDSSDYCTLENNLCDWNYEDGIRLYYSDDTQIINNTCTNNDLEGIILDEECYYTLIENNTLTYNGDTGIWVYYYCYDTTIRGNNCSYNEYGIYIEDSEYNTIEDNVCNWNTDDAGIYLDYADYNDVVNNTCMYNGGEGIYSSSSSFTSMEGNTLLWNEQEGIQVRYGSSIWIENNDCSNNSYAGIDVEDVSSNGYLWENTCYDNGESGIDCMESEGIHVEENDCHNNSAEGITIQYCSDSSVVNNSVSLSGDDGLDIENSERVTIENNTVKNCNDEGLSIQETEYATVKNNTLVDNPSNFGVWGEADPHFNHDIDDSNTADGKTIYYITGVSDMVYDGDGDRSRADGPGDGATYYFIWCENITIRNMELEDNGIGVAFWGTNNSLIEDVYIAYNWWGIFLGNSENNTITGVNASHNGGIGIYLDGSDNNTLTDIITSFNGEYGIEVAYSYNNILDDVTVTSNSGGGIYLYYSDDNEITDSRVEETESDGILLYSAHWNTISDNELVNNGDDAFDVYYSENNTFTYNEVLSNGDIGFQIFSSSNNTMNRNMISENYYGIYVADNSTGNSAHYNWIFNNYYYGVNASDNNGHFINATDNWWDTELGPFHPEDNIDGEGDNVTDYVGYEPWAHTPEITTDDPETETDEDDFFEQEFEVEDEDTLRWDTLEFDFDTDAEWLDFDEKTLTASGTPDNWDVGTYYIQLRVVDSLSLEDTLFYNLEVINTNDPPVITTLEPTEEVLEDSAYYFDLNGTDDDLIHGDTITWLLDTDAEWLEIDEETGELSGTPENDDVGFHQVKVELKDKDGETDELEFEIEVINTNDAPEVTITTPEEDDEVSGTITVEGLFGDMDVGDEISLTVKVDDGEWMDLVADAQEPGRATEMDDWSYDWNTAKYLNGEHIFYARVTDKEGVSTIAQVNVTTSNLYEGAEIDLEASAELLPMGKMSFSVEGSVETGEDYLPPSLEVYFSLDFVELNTVPLIATDGEFSWGATLNEIPPGRHTLRAETTMPSGVVVAGETEVVYKNPKKLGEVIYGGGTVTGDRDVDPIVLGDEYLSRADTEGENTEGERFDSGVGEFIYSGDGFEAETDTVILLSKDNLALGPGASDVYLFLAEDSSAIFLLDGERLLIGLQKGFAALYVEVNQAGRAGLGEEGAMVGILFEEPLMETVFPGEEYKVVIDITDVDTTTFFSLQVPEGSDSTIVTSYEGPVRVINQDDEEVVEGFRTITASPTGDLGDNAARYDIVEVEGAGEVSFTVDEKDISEVAGAYHIPFFGPAHIDIAILPEGKEYAVDVEGLAEDYGITISRVRDMEQQKFRVRTTEAARYGMDKDGKFSIDPVESGATYDLEIVRDTDIGESSRFTGTNFPLVDETMTFQVTNWEGLESTEEAPVELTVGGKTYQLVSDLSGQEISTMLEEDDDDDDGNAGLIVIFVLLALIVVAVIFVSQGGLEKMGLAPGAGGEAKPELEKKPAKSPEQKKESEDGFKPGKEPVEAPAEEKEVVKSPEPEKKPVESPEPEENTDSQAGEE